MFDLKLPKRCNAAEHFISRIRQQLTSSHWELWIVIQSPKHYVGIQENSQVTLQTVSELLHCRSLCHLYCQGTPLPYQCEDSLPIQLSSSKNGSPKLQDLFQFPYRVHRLPLRAFHLHRWGVNYMQAYSLKHNHKNNPLFFLLPFLFSHQKAFVRSLG